MINFCPAYFTYNIHTYSKMMHGKYVRMYECTSFPSIAPSSTPMHILHSDDVVHTVCVRTYVCTYLCSFSLQEQIDLPGIVTQDYHPYVFFNIGLDMVPK